MLHRAKPTKLVSRSWSGSSMMAGLAKVKVELPDDPEALQSMVQETEELM